VSDRGEVQENSGHRGGGGEGGEAGTAQELLRPYVEEQRTRPRAIVLLKRGIWTTSVKGSENSKKGGKGGRVEHARERRRGPRGLVAKQFEKS